MTERDEVNIKLLFDLVVSEFGPRCPDFSGNCITCLAWAAHDALSEKVALASLDTTSEAGRKDEIRAELRCVDENLQSAGDHAENHALEGERNSLLAEIHALGALPAEVTELVIAARIVAFEDQSPEALRRLDQASEAFAGRVKWNDEG